MRLLVDCHCFDYGEAQGINTYIKELYRGLIPIAKDITFVFAAQNLDKIKRLFGEGYNIEYIKLGNHNKYYRLAFEFPKIIKKHSIDWAHFQYTSPVVKNCKTIVTLHDILFEDFPNEFPLSYRISKHLLFKTSAKRADMLLTVSDYSKQRIADVYNIPSKDIYVTHNGVNNEFRELDKVNSASAILKRHNIKNYILYVSRFEPRKNQQALLRAYKNLRLDRKGYELVFIGVKSLGCVEFDKEYDSCDENIRNNVHLFENIPYEELKEWIAGASLFVYPSKAEGFGIPPLEAAAAGVPVICNNQTAMADFTFFSPCHFNTDNQQELEKCIHDTLKYSPDEHDLSKIQNSIYEKYSWDKIATGYYNQLKHSYK